MAEADQLARESRERRRVHGAVGGIGVPDEGHDRIGRHVGREVPLGALARQPQPFEEGARRVAHVRDFGRRRVHRHPARQRRAHGLGRRQRRLGPDGRRRQGFEPHERGARRGPLGVIEIGLVQRRQQRREQPPRMWRPFRAVAAIAGGRQHATEQVFDFEREHGGASLVLWFQRMLKSLAGH